METDKNGQRGTTYTVTLHVTVTSLVVMLCLPCNYYALLTGTASEESFWWGKGKKILKLCFYGQVQA